MGSTFSALYVRNASLKAIADLVSEGMKKSGFVLQSEPVPNAFVRNIVLLEKDGWVLLADEALELEDASGAASTLSRKLNTEIIEVAVNDSDRAWLRLFSKGKEIGSLRIPADAKRNKEGYRLIGAEFLKGLATTEEASKQLVEGIRYDETFAEDAVEELLKRIGMTLPLLGASYLLDDRNPSATYLAFCDSRIPATQPHVVAPKHPELNVNGYSSGADLYAEHNYEFGFSVENHGADTSGIDVELEGSALNLLTDIQIQADKIQDEGNNRTKRTEFHGKLRESSGKLIASIPNVPILYAMNALLAVAIAPVKSGRTIKDAIEQKSRAECYVRIRLRGRRPGTGDLNIKIRPHNSTKGAAEHPPFPVVVFPKPRVPILPDKTVRPLSFQESQHDGDWHYCEALANYAGNKFAVGWIALDGPFSAHREYILKALMRIADCALSATKVPNLKVAITSAGARLRGKPKYSQGDDLNSKGWRATFDRISTEGIVTFNQLVQERDFERDEITLLLSHQPAGDTRYDAAKKKSFARIGMTLPRPTELFWCIPRAPDADAMMATVINGLMNAAANWKGVIGGYACAISKAHVYLSADENTPYEELRDRRAGTSQDWCRDHIRTPAWRVIVPKKAAALLGKVPKNISVQTAENATLVGSTAADPFSMTSDHFEALERFLLPCVGTQKEWKSYESKMAQLAEKAAKKLGTG